MYLIDVIKRSLALSCILLSGCATIVSKSHYDISVKASEPGTTVKIFKGEELVKTALTPVTVELDASDGLFSSATYRFVFEKDGFEGDASMLKSKLDPCYWINLICLYSAPLGMLVVDPLSGAMWSFDENVTVMGYLRPKEADMALKFKAASERYSILSCEREKGDEFAYRFELGLPDTDGNSIATIQAVQTEFSQMLKNSYSEAHSNIDKESLNVEFSEFTLKGNRVSGRVVVLTIAITSLSYDPNTRKGKLAVKVNANQYEEARKWVRKNIETLARDKNIALTTGEIPPAARFYLGREELKDGNILEVEFKTE